MGNSTRLENALFLNYTIGQASCLSEMSVRDVCPRELSEMSVRDVYPRCLSEMSVRDVCPRCLSEMSVRDVYPRCLSEMSVRDVCPRCLSEANRGEQAIAAFYVYFCLRFFLKFRRARAGRPRSTRLAMRSCDSWEPFKFPPSRKYAACC